MKYKGEFQVITTVNEFFFIQTLLINVTQITMKLEATWEVLQFEFTDVVPSLIALFSVEWMISIKLFKVVALMLEIRLFVLNGVMAVPRGPN